MKLILKIISVLILICFAGNFNDKPQENQQSSKQANVSHLDSNICPNCNDTGCIYFQIEQEMINIGAEPTDFEIRAAAERVFILRGITDSATIKNVLAEYYL